MVVGCLASAPVGYFVPASSPALTMEVDVEWHLHVLAEHRYRAVGVLCLLLGFCLLGFSKTAIGA